MLKREFIELLESVVRGSTNVFKNDKPAIRQLFNDMSDSYCKDGTLTNTQHSNWMLTNRELNRLLKISKG